jgi:hypothetical protein
VELIFGEFVMFYHIFEPLCSSICWDKAELLKANVRIVANAPICSYLCYQWQLQCDSSLMFSHSVLI